MEVSSGSKGKEQCERVSANLSDSVGGTLARSWPFGTSEDESMVSGRAQAKAVAYAKTDRGKRMNRRIPTAIEITP